MIWLVSAVVVYLLAMFSQFFMVDAQTDGRKIEAVIIGAITAILWVVAMYLLFRGLIWLGMFDELVSR